MIKCGSSKLTEIYWSQHFSNVKVFIMNKFLYGIILSLIFLGNVHANQLLNCEDLNDGSVTKVNFNKKNQTWMNELLKPMDAKFVNGNFYTVLEFPEEDKYTLATIMFNSKTKKLFVNLYDMSTDEISNALLNAYSRYMNEKKVFDINDISKKDGMYIFYNAVEDNFTASRKTTSYCGKKIKTNQSNNISNLPEILKNPDKVEKGQLVEYLIEVSHILKKGKIHLKKCIDEHNLYNSLKEKYCSSLYKVMRDLYIPAEKALNAIGPKIQVAYNKYGKNIEDAPAWYKELDKELGIVNSNTQDYIKVQQEVKALFAAN